MPAIIHSTAIIGNEVSLSDEVTIGPHCILEGNIKIGAGTLLKANVHLWGDVEIGINNTIYSHAVIGEVPQDLSFSKDTKSGVIIGDNNTIRENCTIHRASIEGENTILGNHNLLMAGAHMGHDTVVKDHAILANNVMLAGFVEVGNRVFLGGSAGIHQFVKVGDYSLMQGNGGLTKDLPPYCLTYGINKMPGLNIVGLKRAGFTPEQRKEIKHLFFILFQSKLNLSDAIVKAQEETWTPSAQLMLDAVMKPSKKGTLTR